MKQPRNKLVAGLLRALLVSLVKGPSRISLHKVPSPLTLVTPSNIMSASERHFDTIAVAYRHTHTDRSIPLSEPIVRATTFAAESAAEHARLYQRGTSGFYQRFGSPTTAAAAAQVAALEGAEAALVFSSGMGAISTVLMTLLGSGRHIVAHKEIFAQTQEFLEHLNQHFGVELTSVDARDANAVAKAIRSTTALVYIETPTNPRLELIDIASVSNVCRPRGIPLIVDGTFASPALQRALSLGADVSVHSGTKYLGGHSDVLCGVASGGAQLIGRVRLMQRLMGTILDPEAAWLLLRGIRTLSVRIDRQCQTAARVAAYLERRDSIAEVRYPGLPSHPDFATGQHQMRAGGGMITFRAKGGRGASAALVDRLRLIQRATSLGGVESVIELPYDLDFSAGPKASGSSTTPTDADADRAGLIRLSIGLEHADDLIADLDQAIAAIDLD